MDFYISPMIRRIHIAGTLLLGCLVSVSTSAAAQQQKTGYVDTDLIVSKIPEYQSIQQKLQALSREWKSELDEMQDEIDRLKEDFTSKEILYAEEIRKQREQEIQNKIRLREQYMNQKFGPDGDYFQQQKDLLEPIQRRIYEAIAVVAEREGYDFVFDRAQDVTLLFAKNEWNLNEEVMLQIGINPDGASN